jgi:hypothetical protein
VRPDVRLLPDRALDCGTASFGGVPIAWLSGHGEAIVPGDWRASWGGGLVTTCGLRNVGAPSEGFGLHGDVSFQPARDVTAAEGVVRGTVVDGDLVLEREWRLGDDAVRLRDVCRNEGVTTEPAPLLYHVNFGPPFWARGARLMGTERPIPRDDDAAAHLDVWDRYPEVRGPERVYEHVPAPTSVSVVNAELAVTVRWGGLDRLHQWIDPGLGALALEPANCSVLGRAADRAAGRLPALEPGEERVTTLEIQASSTSNATSSE